MNLLNKLFGKKEQIVDRTRRDEYYNITKAAFENEPNDVLKQLKYVKDNGKPENYLTFLLQEGQKSVAYSNTPSKLSHSKTQVDYILRLYLDSVAHMQNNLPDGVYEYAIPMVEGFVESTIKQVMESKQE